MDNELEELKKYGAVPVTEPNTTTGIVRYGLADPAAGLATSLQGIVNAPHNIVNAISEKAGKYIPSTPDVDFYKKLGINDKNGWDDFIGGAAGFLPYTAGGEALLGGRKLSYAGNMGRAAAEGGAYGLTQSKDNPFLSGVLDAAGGSAVAGILPPIFHGIKFLAGKGGEVENKIRNSILNYLSDQSNKKLALTPDEASQNLQKYTDSQGNPLPVDIGTTTNNEKIGKLYSNLANVPFSGVSDAKTSIRNSMARKRVDEAQNLLNIELDRNKSHQENIDAVKQQIAKTGLPPITTLHMINTVPEVHEEANTVLNNLVRNVEDRTQVNAQQKQDVINSYKQTNAINNKKWEPINNSNISINKQEGNINFPKYKIAATELLNKQDDLRNLFGSDSDLGSKLNSEIDKASEINENTPGKNKIVTLQEGVGRYQNLAKLAAAARSQGNHNEARLLDNLGNSLKDDIHTNLESQGHNDISDKLREASSFYRDHIIPFYKDRIIRNTIFDKTYTPVNDELAKSLFNPNNKGVSSKLSPETMQNSLFKLFTGGFRENANGYANMDATDIAKKYNNSKQFNQQVKNLVSQYNPDLNRYFETLDNRLFNKNESDRIYNENLKLKNEEQKNNFIENQKSNDKLLTKTTKIKDKSDNLIEKLQSNLENEKEKLYGTHQDDSVVGNASGNIAKGATVALSAVKPSLAFALSPLALLGKRVATILRDPELSKKYVQQQRYDINLSAPKKTQELINSVTLPAFNYDEKK